MIVNSVSLIVLVLATTLGWILAAMVIGVCLSARQYKKGQLGSSSPIQPPPARFAAEAILLAAVPVAVLAFGLAFWRRWETEPPHPEEAQLLRVLAGIALLQIIPLTWFIWRHCRR